jgi:DNA mismatch endonuclease, patch repair protein
MTDFMTPKQRSQTMSKVRGYNTEPEKFIRSRLHTQGFRFRINNSSLPGKPDIVLKKYNAIIFIHGCFWHNHKGCKKSKLPDTRHEFWRKKITDTVRRDQRNISDLSKLGWRIATVWECRTQKKDVLDQTTKKLSKWLKGNKRQIEI